MNNEVKIPENMISEDTAIETTLEKTKKSERRIGTVVFGVAMLFLLFLKSIHMYSLINVGDYVLPLACMTVAIVGLIYFIITIFSPKAANITLTVIYTVLSVIMAVDLVYYNYMGKLPSVMIIEMAWQLGGVGGTIKELTGFRQILPLLDLPLWLLFPLIKKLTRKYIPDIGIRKRNHIITAVAPLVLCVLCIIGYIFFGSFKLRYLPNEIVLYHSRDILAACLPEGNGLVDTSLYVSDENAHIPFYGVAEGRNVFVIQVEALQNFVIGENYNGEVLTPVLNSLIENDSFYFENYYYQIGGGNTADAEFAVNNSLYPSEDSSSYEKYTDNNYHGLPMLLKDQGYSTATVFHAYYENFWSRNKAYPMQGFDDFISIEDVEYHPGEGCVFAIDGKTANNDRRLFEDVLETVVTYEEPFYSFIITLSSHHPFSVHPNDRYVDSNNTSPNLFNLYIQSIAYFDRVLGEFIENLKKEGLYDNSIFVIYGDHYAISETNEDLKADIEAMTGENYDIFDRFNVPLIIHIPGMGTARTLDTVGGHIDVLPTLLSLMGIKNDKAVMFGHNLLTPGYDGIVNELTHVKSGSFITKDIFYVNSEGGINSKVYGKDGQLLENDDSYMKYIEAAQKAIDDCHTLLDNNDILLD